MAESILRKMLEAIGRGEKDLLGILDGWGYSIERFAEYFPTCMMTEQLELIDVLKENDVVRKKARVETYLQNWKNEPDSTKTIIIRRVYQTLKMYRKP